MLTLLRQAELELPALLASRTGWRGMRIDYHAPFVDRVWRPWRDCRLALHRIHPCAPGDALLHPHPWPSAMRVCEGTYEMSVGYGAGLTAPPIATRLIARGDLSYEMTDRDAWHAVRPVDAIAMTVMLSGPPWERAMPVEPDPQSPLPDAEVEEILTYFRARYDCDIRRA